MTANLITEKATKWITGQKAYNSVDALDKGMIHVPMGRSGKAWDFIAVLRMACSLKLINCLFWNSPLNIFRPWSTLGNWNHGKQNHVIRGDYCTRLGCDFFTHLWESSVLTYSGSSFVSCFLSVHCLCTDGISGIMRTGVAQKWKSALFHLWSVFPHKTHPFWFLAKLAWELLPPAPHLL